MVGIVLTLVFLFAGSLKGEKTDSRSGGQAGSGRGDGCGGLDQGPRGRNRGQGDRGQGPQVLHEGFGEGWGTTLLMLLRPWRCQVRRRVVSAKASAAAGGVGA